MNESLRFELHADGSFDLIGPSCTVHNAWPALDAAPIRAFKVECETKDGQSQVRYRLAHGRSILLLFFSVNNGVRLRTQLEGFVRTPHWVSPIFDAEIKGVSKIFRTGIGFSGPTNCIDLSTLPGEYSFDSYLVTGLGAPDGTTLAFGAFVHADFTAKAHLSNRIYRHNFRNREIERNLPRLEFMFATERVEPMDATLVLPDIIFTAGTQTWESLRGWTEQLASERRLKPTLKPNCHFCSWYDRGPEFSQADLDRLLEGLRDRPEPWACIQIDAGYFPSAGDWLFAKEERWPGGLPRAFQRIRDGGFIAGIWMAPFMVGSGSRLATDHPDWILRDLDGRPIPKWKRPEGGEISGPTDDETYILDTSHPDALAYLERVFRTLHGWGARFFKTDFLEWGYVDSTTVRRARPGRTSAQYYHEAMQTIRRAIEDSYWLGCISYFAPMIGFCDGMRVSSDVGVRWEGPGGTGNDGVGGGIPNSIEESHGCHFFHNVLWQNDPDVTFFREKNIELSTAEIESLAWWNGILGVSINTSDCLPELSDRRHQLWRFVQPQATPWTGRILGWPHRGSWHAVTRSYPDYKSHALLLFNPGSEPVRGVVKLRDALGIVRGSVFLWRQDGTRALGDLAEVSVDLPPHHSALYYISPGGEAPPRGLSLGGHSASSA